MNSVWRKNHPEFWKEGSRAGSMFIRCVNEE